MTVAIVTDSSACIPPDLAHRHGITVVPIQLTIDGETMSADAVERGRLLELIDTGAELSTSGPAPADFLDALDANADRPVLVITLASSMSGTYSTARFAADQVLRDDVEVLDSGSAAGGHALIALAAARSAAAGGALHEVHRAAQQAADRVHLIAAVGSLEHLARSGRVPNLASRAGDALGVRPLFSFRDGKPHVMRPSLADDKVLSRLVEAVFDDRPDRDARLHCSVLHADRPEDAETLLDRLTTQSQPTDSFVATFDAAMIVHTGPDLLGIAWWWQPGA